jgi:pentatricopeptide repeat protein
MRCLEGMMELQTTRNVDQQLGFMLRNELEGTSPDPSRVVALWSLADARDASLHWRQTTGVMHAFVQLERHLDAFRVATRHAAAGSKVTERLCEVIATGLACDPSLVDEAYFLLEGLHGKGKPVPLQAANLIIEACARIPDLDRAFATWAELSKLSLTPDIGTYNALLSTCVKARELSSARRLLHRLETEGVAQDAKTYAQRVVMHVLSNEPQQAMAVYRQCVDAELKPPVATYHTLINMLLRRKPTPNVAAAEELLTAMKAQHGRGHAGLERNVADAAEAVNKGEKYKLPLSRSQEMQRQKREERQAAAGAGAAPVAGK